MTPQDWLSDLDGEVGKASLFQGSFRPLRVERPWPAPGEEHQTDSDFSVTLPTTGSAFNTGYSKNQASG